MHIFMPPKWNFGTFGTLGTKWGINACLTLFVLILMANTKSVKWNNASSGLARGRFAFVHPFRMCQGRAESPTVAFGPHHQSGSGHTTMVVHP